MASVLLHDADSAKTAKKELELCALRCVNPPVIFFIESSSTDSVHKSSSRASCVHRLGVTGSTSVTTSALLASGGKALAADGAAET